MPYRNFKLMLLFSTKIGVVDYEIQDVLRKDFFVFFFDFFLVFFQQIMSDKLGKKLD